MTAKLTASADGSNVLIGTAAENALEINATTKVVKALAPYSLAGNGPAFSATGSGGMTVNVEAKVVNINVEQFDTNNCYANSRFTPNVAGYYQITGGLGGDTLDTNYVFPKIFKNGANYSAAGSGAVAGSANSWAANISSLVYLNGTTDYVELWATVVGSPSQTTSYFSGVLVRAA